MKKITEPKLEVVHLEKIDVIATSGVDPTGTRPGSTGGGGDE